MSAGASPQTPFGELTAIVPIGPLAAWVGPLGKGKEGGKGKKREMTWENEGGEGVPECPNPELASLHSDEKLLVLASV